MGGLIHVMRTARETVKGNFDIIEVDGDSVLSIQPWIWNMAKLMGAASVTFFLEY